MVAVDVPVHIFIHPSFSPYPYFFFPFVTTLFKVKMERFVVTAPPARNRSKTALYVTPLDRVTEFGGELHEDGGKLFCTSCNVVLNHVRKSAISDHLKSKTHTKRKAEFEEQNVRKKQRPLTASLQCNSTAQTEKVSVIQDFVKMCLEANIPLEKADHPAVRAFLSRHVKNGGSIPKAASESEAPVAQSFIYRFHFHKCRLAL
ncbi:hypothetical protein QTO34_014338 [Cnephaeus nilssonii]|uniref:CGG triplet repeat-binding protein 1 n=1 Tax=Cnephaeus nilssonii TaxID=3371016 RepID=A0AA40LS74_CNENI|nr:hypothetical protein QTO34_014338 [Eptesicus nilssonii]